MVVVSLLLGVPPVRSKTLRKPGNDDVLRLRGAVLSVFIVLASDLPLMPSSSSFAASFTAGGCWDRSNTLRKPGSEDALRLRVAANEPFLLRSMLFFRSNFGEVDGAPLLLRSRWTLLLRSL